MKKFFYSFFVFFTSLQGVYAEDRGIFGDCSGINLRKGDIHIDDIGCMIQSTTNFFMSIAGTIAVIFVIVGAYKMLFGSLEQDQVKGRETIVAALGGFVLAGLAWFIVRFIISNFS